MPKENNNNVNINRKSRVGGKSREIIVRALDCYQSSRSIIDGYYFNYIKKVNTDDFKIKKMTP